MACKRNCRYIILLHTSYISASLQENFGRPPAYRCKSVGSVRRAGNFRADDDSGSGIGGRLSPLLNSIRMTSKANGKRSNGENGSAAASSAAAGSTLGAPKHPKLTRHVSDLTW